MIIIFSNVRIRDLRGEVNTWRCTKSTEWIWPKLTEKQVYESLRPLRSKSRKCSVRFCVVAITRFLKFPNSQLPSQQRTELSESGDQNPMLTRIRISPNRPNEPASPTANTLAASQFAAQPPRTPAPLENSVVNITVIGSHLPSLLPFVDELFKVREFEKSCNGDYAKSNATLSRFRS